jgi:putative colanic acid biosysnthesis UDP-glucose lipid carrier transferase
MNMTNTLSKESTGGLNVYSERPKNQKFVFNTDFTMREILSRKNIYLAFKRIFDIVISLLVIIGILSWLTPILAILIKLESRGPVFFVQKRVGFLGKIFYCYKFRSMTLNVEADFKQATDADYRITRLGKFLRKCNIDELPQFFNVLVGDMSIVGPRPHMLYDCLCFSYHIENYKNRNVVKPGITGLAQVRGLRGPITSRGCMTRRYVHDIVYISNISFFLDCKIMFITAKQTMTGLTEKFASLFASKPATFIPMRAVGKAVERA